MSNVIKSFNIRYTDVKKTIDLNDRADEFQRLYIESLPKFKEIDKNSEKEIHESYFLPEDSGMSIPLNGEDGEKLLEIVRNKLEHELQEKREAAEEECRLLRIQAEEECRLLMEEATKKAEIEKKRLFDQAKKDGYQEGKEIAIREAEGNKAELQKLEETLRQDYEYKIERMEPDIIELVIGLVRNLTGVLLEERKDIILHIIRHSLLGLENSSSFIVRVSKEDYEFINTKRQELLDELQGNKIEIVSDSTLQHSQCTIETDTRVLDCSLDVQLKNLTTDLKLLAGIIAE